MDEKIKNRIIDTVAYLGWSVNFYEDEMYFENYTPCGENIIIEVCKEKYTFQNILKEVKSVNDYFDPEEHAVMWYKTHGLNGAPTSIRTLLEDADVLTEMYKDLYIALLNINCNEF